MPPSLKDRKESFVSGHTGSTIQEINLVTSIALITYLLYRYLASQTTLFSKDQRYSTESLLIDWVLSWGALLLSVTTYSDRTGLLIVGLVVPVLALGLLFKKEKDLTSKDRSSKLKKTNKSKKEELTLKTYLPKKPFLTAYRSGMLILTSIAILAVDFPLFPRRFAKVETWGTSLMDLGVGSFVFSLGVVSARPLLSEAFRGVKKSYFSRVYEALRGTVTCLALGLIRLIAVKNLEYQEHVTEYGVHWNFFITLVLVGPMTILISPVFSLIPRVLVSLIIALVYELALIHKEGLLQFLLLGQRVDLVSMNREGLFSLIGYVAIFIAGQSCGNYLLPSTPSPNNLFRITVPSSSSSSSSTLSNKKQSIWEKYTTVTPLQGLTCTFIAYLTLTYLSLETNIISPLPVSRRLANLPYVLWVCTYNVGFLLCYSLIDTLFTPSTSSPSTVNVNANESYEAAIPLTLEAVNFNGMIIFLLANLGTGLVNMTINTLDCDNGVALAVMVGYCVVLSGLSLGLLKYGIAIKI